MKLIKSIGVAEFETEGIRAEYNVKTRIIDFHGWCGKYEVEGFAMDIMDFCRQLGIESNKRKAAIEWIKAFRGDSDKYDAASWDDIITKERIMKEFAGDDIRLQHAVMWGVKEGAMAMLVKIFDITKDEKE